MGGIRKSRKRKIIGPKRLLNGVVALSVYERLDLMSGPEPLMGTIEQLINREWARRVKKQSLQVQDNSLIPTTIAS